MRLQELTQILKSSHLKQTGHRLEILSALEKADSPLSAETLRAILLKKGHLVPLSTVYRTLEALVESRLVTKLPFESQSRSLYEFNRGDHHHFLVCLGCDKIVKVEGCPIPEEAETALREENGFHIVGHRLEFFGYCPECKEKFGY